MDTALKRKIIDIKEDTFRSLSVKAAEKGMNLKKFIETLLDKEAENVDDNGIYGHLLKQNPEGKKYLNKKEQADFENWLGV